MALTSAGYDGLTSSRVVFSAGGLYIAGDGTWTDNSALGKLLGATAQTINVTKQNLIDAGLISGNIADTAALRTAVNAYMQGKAADGRYAGDLEVTGGGGNVTLFMAHYDSAASDCEGLWTTSGGLAATLDFKSATINFTNVSDFTALFSAATGRLESGSVSFDGAALTATDLANIGTRVTALGVSGTVKTGLYYTSGSNYWTEELELGRTLDNLKELSVTLGAGEDINALMDVLGTLTREISSEIVKSENALNLQTGVE
jgi:hypothetical protein